jgi:hypothetical protein
MVGGVVMCMQEITREEIATALELHGRAYEALLWLSNISFARPQMLTSETVTLLQKAGRCVEWVSARAHDFPERVRPSRDDVQAFARLFASFFQTSFRIERCFHDREPYFRIVRNRDEAAGRDRLSSRKVPRGLVRKRKDEAAHLKYRAMTYLADENTPGFWDCARELIAEATLRRDLVLWTWACELVHRSRGEPHGPAVHLLWRQIDDNVRKQMSIARIWQARDRLTNALQASMRQHQRVAALTNGEHKR